MAVHGKHCPDLASGSTAKFPREGSAVDDCLHPERVVVGCDDPEGARRFVVLFATESTRVIVTDAARAETIKYVANAFLATKLSCVNAVATLCDHLGASISDVLVGLGSDHRIGFDYLRSGRGWGGSCLPKDTRVLLYMAQCSDYEFPRLREVIDTNQVQLESVVEEIGRALGHPLAQATVAVWRLSFKAGTDEGRRSPAVNIVAQFVAAAARVRAYDAAVSGPVPELPHTIVIARDPYDACTGSEVVAVLTDWEELTKLYRERVRETMTVARMVDVRNLFDARGTRDCAFEYVRLGNAGPLWLVACSWGQCTPSDPRHRLQAHGSGSWASVESSTYCRRTERAPAAHPSTRVPRVSGRGLLGERREAAGAA